MFLLLLAQHALAWELIDPAPYAWTEFPIVLTPTDEEIDGLAAGETLGTIDFAATAWMGHQCAEHVTFTVDSPTTLYRTFDLGDRRNHIVVNDPDNDLEPGVIAASLVSRFGSAWTHNGIRLMAADNGDIAFNDNVNFVLADDVAGCTDAWVVEAVLAHELGHVLGFGHSSDPEATMASTPDQFGPAACDAGPASLSPDDISGLQALYAFGFGVSCSPWVGLAPHTVDCVLETNDNPAGNVSWETGDGGSGSGESFTHTFTEAGPQEVRVCATPASCDDEWCTTVTVGVCDAVDPRPEAAPTLEPLVVQLLNNSPIPAAGCVQGVAWTVKDAAGEVIATPGNWEPVVLLPGPGAYTAELQLMGIDDEWRSAEIHFDTNDFPEPKDAKSGGCGCHQGRGTGLGALIALSLLGLRRRRGGAARSG